jgi:hypothetical protein
LDQNYQATRQKVQVAPLGKNLMAVKLMLKDCCV